MKRIQGCVISAMIFAAVVPLAAAAQTTEAGGTDPATSQQDDDMILVTAERRVGNVQDTAAAVSVRSGAELAAQGRYSTRQILEDIPGLIAEENNSRNTGSSDVQGNNITIRGISPGETAGPGFSQISPTPATAVYVDGIYEGVGGVHDIERVEVLRGPQGTLYGRSATAGVVAFHTRDPQLNEYSGNASVEVGSYELRHFSGALNVPIGNTIAVRVSGDLRDQNNGYFGEADRGMRERQNIRAKLLWEPSDDLSVLLGYAYEDDRAFSGGTQTTTSPTTGALTTTTFGIGNGRKEQNQYWAEINWDVGPVVITYEPAYRTWQQNDNNILEGNFLASGAQLRQLISTPHNTFHTQELRMASNWDSPISFLVGAFYYENNLDTSLRNFLANSSNAEIALQSQTADEKSTKDVGLFADLTFEASEDLRFTVGARYDDTEIVFTETAYENPFSLCGTFIAPTLPFFPLCTGPGRANAPQAPSLTVTDLPINFTNFNYKGRVEYDLADDHMVYASVSTGFRPGDGGISQVNLPPPQLPVLQLNIYDSEKLTAFEVGSKNQFLDNSLTLNAAAFYYNYSGYHVTFLPETPAFDPATRGTSTRTSVPARVTGGELEMAYRPTDADQFAINYNYVRFRWHDKPAAFALAQTENGRAVVPHTIQASYQHTFGLADGHEVAFRIDGKFESAHRTDDLHIDHLRLGYGDFVNVGDRMVGNAQLRFVTEDRRFSISAYVRNFTNAKQPVLIVGGNLNALTTDFRDPRTFGVIASVNF